jgi:hypothetical protein
MKTFRELLDESLFEKLSKKNQEILFGRLFHGEGMSVTQQPGVAGSRLFVAVQPSENGKDVVNRVKIVLKQMGLKADVKFHKSNDDQITDGVEIK